MAGKIWEQLQSNLAVFFLTKSIYLNKVRHHWEVPTTLKFLKEKVEGSDRDVTRWKTHSCMLFLNFTRNHAITYTNTIIYLGKANNQVGYNLDLYVQ